MPYIGRPLNAGNLAVQSGTGDGSDTTPIATLDYSVGSSNSIGVYLDGVRQLAGTDFTASGTALTFTTAPANLVGIDVYFLGLELSIPTPADATVTTAKLADNSVTSAKIVDATILNADIGAAAAIATTKLGAGATVQVVNVQTGAAANGTTVLPDDDTIPQKTEGVEFMTLAITPTHASNKLLIQVILNVTSGVAVQTIGVALFQDTTAGALASQQIRTADALRGFQTFNHYMAAGTTSETTFKVRAGGSAAGTTYINGYSSGRVHGGTIASSITITEIKA